jgi:hypothetical protein
VNWYEENIEEPVRKVVKLLRENGFNTECSCGHDMYVQCQYMVDGELQRLERLLLVNGYNDYEINLLIRRTDGHLFTTMDIRFKKE